MFVCMCIHMYVCGCVCIWLYMCTSIIYTQIYTQHENSNIMHTLYLYVCVHIHIIYKQMNIYIYIYTSVNPRISILVHVECPVEFSGAESAPWNSFFETVFQAAFAYTVTSKAWAQLLMRNREALRSPNLKAFKSDREKWPQQAFSNEFLPKWLQELLFRCGLTSPSESRSSVFFSFFMFLRA